MCPAPTELRLNWLFDWINLDPKIQIKYVDTKHQLADIPTKGSFTRDEWHNLLHLLNIMNETTFSCSHFSNSHSFLSAGKQSRTWEERNTKSRWYSVQHASGNREYTRKVVQNMKDRLRRDESSSDIPMISEKMHISIWTRFMASSMQAALHMDPSCDKNLELFKNSEF